jgi:hypothetical protein
LFSIGVYIGTFAKYDLISPRLSAIVAPFPQQLFYLVT